MKSMCLHSHNRAWSLLQDKDDRKFLVFTEMRLISDYLHFQNQFVFPNIFFLVWKDIYVKVNGGFKLILRTEGAFQHILDEKY